MTTLTSIRFWYLLVVLVAGLSCNNVLVGAAAVATAPQPNPPVQAAGSITTAAATTTPPAQPVATAINDNSIGTLSYQYLNAFFENHASSELGRYQKESNQAMFGHTQRQLAHLPVLHLLLAMGDKTKTAHTNAAQDNVMLAANELNLTALRNLFSAKTLAGKSCLFKMLGTPLHNRQQLEARQKCIRFLVAHDKERKLLEGCINSIATLEPALYDCLGVSNPIVQAQIQQFYFSNKQLEHLNTNPYALQALSTAHTNARFRWELIKLHAKEALITAGLAIPIISLAHGRNPLPELRHYTLGVPAQIIPGTTGHYMLGRPAQPSITLPAQFGVLDPRRYLEHLQNNIREFRENPIRNTILSLIFLTAIKWMNSSLSMIGIEIKHCSSFIEEVQQLQACVERHPALAQGLAGYPMAAHLFDPKLDKTDTFARFLAMTEAPILTNGHELAAHQLARESVQQFGQLLQFIGELDACIAIANTFKRKEQSELVDEYLASSQYYRELAEHENSDGYLAGTSGYQKPVPHATFSFAEYIDQAEPQLNVTDGWHPLVRKLNKDTLQFHYDDTVPNNVTLDGKNGHQSMLITGDNAAGKTVYISMALLNAWLAQTITIVPSKKTSLTPFHCIATAFNSTGNIAESNSKHVAGAKRAAELIKTAQDLNAQGKRCLIGIDEPFSSTKPQEADGLTYTYLSQFALPNTVMIGATHYVESPPKIEAESKGILKNYCLKIPAADEPQSEKFKVVLGLSKDSKWATLIFTQALENARSIYAPSKSKATIEVVEDDQPAANTAKKTEPARPIETLTQQMHEPIVLHPLQQYNHP